MMLLSIHDVNDDSDHDFNDDDFHGYNGYSGDDN